MAQCIIKNLLLLKYAHDTSDMSKYTCEKDPVVVLMCFIVTLKI